MPSPSEPVFYYMGTGIVAVPNQGDATLKVYPQELLADAEGNIVDGTDIQGMTEADIITCEYHYQHPYLNTPPHLAEGDVVTLLQHTDTQVLFWAPFQRSKLRQITKAQYTYPAKKETNVEDSPTNNYILSLDTEKGLLGFYTTKDRDEPVGFNIALDTKNGVFSFVTDNKETFRWNAEKQELVILTKQVKIAADKIFFKGKVMIDGAVEISKTLKVGKAASIGGNLSVRGGIKALTYVRAIIGRFRNL